MVYQIKPLTVLDVITSFVVLLSVAFAIVEWVIIVSMYGVEPFVDFISLVVFWIFVYAGIRLYRTRGLERTK